jgi:sulfonate transport system permease protein
MSEQHSRRFSAPTLMRFPFLQGLLFPLLVIAIWEYLSHRSAAYAYAFVPIEEIWQSLLRLGTSGELFVNMTATLRTAATGLVIGSSVGVLVGVLMGVSRIVDTLVGPLYHAIRQVPLIGWIPLIGLWFGNGLFSKTLIVCLASFYPMVLNTYEGIRNVDKCHREVGRIFRLGHWQTFRHVLMPAALPFIVTGLMQALAFSWISTVGSELLFSAGPGLGGLMQTAQAASRMDVVVLCVACIGVMGFAMNHGLSHLSRRMLRWRNVR